MNAHCYTAYIAEAEQVVDDGDPRPIACGFRGISVIYRDQIAVQNVGYRKCGDVSRRGSGLT